MGDPHKNHFETMGKRVYAQRTRSRTPFKTMSRSVVSSKKQKAGLKRYPFGKSLLSEHRYMEQNVSVDPGVGGAASEYFFSCNGLYDPNITGTGHQPLGFDQIATMFDHYIVYYAQIKVTFHNTDNTNINCVGVRIADDTSTLLSGAEIVENGNLVYATLPPASEGGNSVRELTIDINPVKWLGRDMMSSDIKGDAGNNPSEQCMFSVFAFNTTGVNTGAVDFWVDIIYKAKWIEPRELSLS